MKMGTHDLAGLWRDNLTLDLPGKSLPKVLDIALPIGIGFGEGSARSVTTMMRKRMLQSRFSRPT